jgi:hypothetical protein
MGEKVRAWKVVRQLPTGSLSQSGIRGAGPG